MTAGRQGPRPGRAPEGGLESADAIRKRALALAQNVTDRASAREAKALYRRLERAGALDLESAVNFAILLKNMGELDDAAKRLTAVARLRPDLPGLDYNLGAVFYEAGDWPRAERRFRAAIAQDPDNARARRALGHIRLGYGDVAEGWAAYDSRLAVAPQSARPAALEGVAPWDGASLGGRSLALWGEQGVGEEILFGGFASEIAARLRGEGGTLYLLVDPRLVALFARSVPDAVVLAKDAPAEALANLDFQAPLGALGAVLRGDAAAIPAATATLRADPERRAEMRRWLDSLPGERKLGLSWRSKLTRAADKKTIPLGEWKPILRIRDVTFVNLQYGETDEDLAEVRKRFGVEIAQAPGLDTKDDLDGLAALIAELDRVVTISNVTAHMAGAIGTPTTLLLARSHFWYWGYDGAETCRWYPGMTILRRPRDAWSPIIRQAADQVSREAGLGTR